MELYPDCVYSKLEFSALPLYLFSGADFALIPSCDEPFGLVAVEFGCKGALSVGGHLGGLGLMPRWVSTYMFPKNTSLIPRNCTDMNSVPQQTPLLPSSPAQ